MKRIFLGLLLATFSSLALSHTLAPSLLQISPAPDNPDTNGHAYSILWRLDVLTPQMMPRWPDYCHAGPAQIQRSKRQLNFNYTLQCKGPLDHGQLIIDGLSQAASAVLLRIQDGDNTNHQLIHPAQPVYHFAAEADPGSVWLRYLWLGVEHILAGPDHLLLVLGLFWLGGRPRRILALSLCFTLGHSLTLVLASLRWINLPEAWVELTIAATLLWLALQLGRGPPRHHQPQHSQFVVFSVFGLIHGLGFAGALKDVGLDGQQLLASLLSFNIGIEVGQLLFLLGMGGLLWLSRRVSDTWVGGLHGLSRYAIGSLACYWLLARALLILN